MKILCTGDWHFGLSVGGYDFHDDQVRAIQPIIDAADEADLIVIGGDVFHTSTPTPRSYAAVFNLLDELNVPAIVLVGNHDIGVGTVPTWEHGKERGRIPTPHALEPLKAYRFRVPLIVVDKPGVYPTPGHLTEDLLLVPYINDIYSNYYLGATAQEIVDETFKQGSTDGSPLAAFCHLDVRGVEIGSEGAVLRGGRLVMPDLAQHLTFPVVDQHIHKRQELGNVLFPGSIVATDFSDVDGVWGYMILEV